jgi:MYXO-CTERM domain-containing protein
METSMNLQGIGRWMLCGLGTAMALTAACSGHGPLEESTDESYHPVTLEVDDTGAADLLVGVQQAKFSGSNGTKGFGQSVALSGDTALVAPLNSAVSAFVRSGQTWTKQSFPAPASAASVALEGDRALLSVPNSFIVYVYERNNGGVWSEKDMLYPPGPSGSFGWSVALSGNTALVGAPGDDKMGVDAGSAYVFVLDNGFWIRQAELFGFDGAGASLGWSVALEGDTALVGAYNANNSAGAAYVYVRNGATWAFQAKLVGNMGQDRFGQSVALSQNTALVGAPQHGGNGAAYVYLRSGAAWTQEAELLPSDGAMKPLYGFGSSVALEGDTALVGASADGLIAANAGSAYVYARSGAAWTEESKIVPNDVAANDFFGGSVALEGDTVLVGAYEDDDNGMDSGSAYVFILALSDGSACAAGTACASGSCVDGVCCNTACGGDDVSDCQACSMAAGAAVDGACGPLVAGTECRAAAGDCDAAERCDGANSACPLDIKMAAGTECRAKDGSCDVAESCTGKDDTCPADAVADATTDCRPAAGLCDIAEKCDGVSKDCTPDVLAPQGAPCRTSAGECDVAEMCSGVSVDCPADKSAPDIAPCGEDENDGGCACSIPGGHPTNGTYGALGLMGLGLLAARRYRGLRGR